MKTGTTSVFDFSSLLPLHEDVMIIITAAVKTIIVFDDIEFIFIVIDQFVSPICKRYFFQTTPATLRPNFRPSTLSACI